MSTERQRKLNFYLALFALTQSAAPKRAKQQGMEWCQIAVGNHGLTRLTSSWLQSFSSNFKVVWGGVKILKERQLWKAADHSISIWCKRDPTEGEGGNVTPIIWSRTWRRPRGRRLPCLRTTNQMKERSRTRGNCCCCYCFGFCWSLRCFCLEIVLWESLWRIDDMEWKKVLQLCSFWSCQLLSLSENSLLPRSCVMGMKRKISSHRQPCIIDFPIHPGTCSTKN